MTEMLREARSDLRPPCRQSAARGLRIFWVGLWIVVATPTAAALDEATAIAQKPLEEHAKERGRALAEAVFRRTQGERVVTHQRMELLDPGREPRVRELFAFRRGTDDTEHAAASLIRFSAPADIAGMGLLTIGEIAADSEQWIYLPARSMTRRIPSGQQGARFAGSDFFYEDLRDRDSKLDRHTWQGSVSLNGVDTEVIASIPFDPNSSVYAKRLAWIDPERALALRVDYFAPIAGRGSDPAEQPFKRYWVLDVGDIDGRPTVIESVMEDLQSGHRTRLINLSTSYDERIPDRLFTRRALEDAAIERDFRP